LLDEKGSPQSLELLQGKNFWSFVYDIFIGIRFHRKSSDKQSDPTATAPENLKHFAETP
jgi:beta-carotene hydroxylase